MESWAIPLLNEIISRIELLVEVVQLITESFCDFSVDVIGRVDL